MTVSKHLLEEAHLLQSKDHPFYELRQAGWETYTRLGWPGKRTEAYKFTPLDTLLNKAFKTGFASYQSKWPKQAEAFFFDAEGHHLVFVNGWLDKEQSKIIEDPALSMTSFSEMSSTELKEELGSLTQEEATVALNQAFLTDGIKFKTSASGQAKPVFIYHFRDATEGATFSFPRFLVDVAENSEIRFTEQTFDQGSHPHLSIPITEARIQKHGRFRWNKLQLHGENAHTIDHHLVHQEDNSHSYLNTFSLSGGLIRNNPHLILDGEHVEANLYGLYLLNKSTHVDNHTVVDHRKPHGNSNEMYKGIVDERSTGVFNGKIYVRQAAQKTNAFQANNNVVLSDDANLHTKPQLEIWADDVKCSHGCTSGQMDEEALFYLQARGIPRNKAKAMLLVAFAEEALSHVELEQVRDLIESNIEDRLQ